MSPPGPSWRLRGRANFRSEASAQVDAAGAFAEWLSLVEAIQACGGKAVVLPPVDELTGLPYCAEAGHPLPDRRFLLPRMWAPHRKGEAAHWKPVVERMGFETIELGAGFWEGQGDVASFLGTTLLFYGGRTDRAGLEAARPFFPNDALEIEVRQPAFHGNVAVLAIDSIGRMVVCPDFIAGDGMDRLRDRFGADTLFPISADESRHYATNALPIGKTLIAPSIAPGRVLDELAALGMDLVTLKMTELCEKAGGASRCLVCRIAPEIAESVIVPDAYTLEGYLQRLA
jgi:N-dimethylarginine dimethylaminohydrolase